jgi:two-component system, LytTR family, sensor kinase
LSQQELYFVQYQSMKISIRTIRLFAPLAFWAFQILILIIRNIYRMGDLSFSEILSPALVTFPLDCFTFCAFYYFFAPKYFKKERPALYIPLGLAFFILHGFIWISVYHYLGVEKTSRLMAFYASSMGHSLLYAFYAIVFRMAIDWFEKQNKQKELDKQHIKTELALLRSQINPHFLFNTLNNIHSFVMKDKDKASFALIKLSEIMRYMLYEAKGEEVFLIKEVEYLENFIKLHQLRYKNPDFVSFRTKGIRPNLMVPPMLFIPFIENAFKHGKKSGDGKIKIALILERDEIRFTCLNQKRELNKTEQKEPKGIGIQNIKRRLELLYPAMHKLAIEEDEKYFSAKLMIKLK